MTPEPRRPVAGLGTLSRGTRLGPYRVDGVLGHGGMGEVYRADDTRLGRPVALKFLRSDVSSDKHALERLQIEARAASSLNHPNICTIYEIGEADGRTFIAMELLEGQTLREQLSGKALKAEQLLRLSIQLAEGLEAAHAKGIIHRDIKPENVFVVPQDRVKILDFGLAKLYAPAGHPDDGTGATSEQSTRMAHLALTLPGFVMGTPAYMSPEQVRGEELDSRTDLFSLGSVLFEMASGISAFQGLSHADTSAAILGHTPVLPACTDSRIRAALQEILNKALEKNREFRYQHASDLLADLKRVRRDLDAGLLDAAAPLPAASVPAASLGSNLASDVIRAAAFATLVFLAHGCLDRRPSGKVLEQFQVAFVQEALRRGPASDADFEAGGKSLPLVVDISRLHPDKKQRTDRRMLDALIDELRRRGASAIGVDLLFDDLDGSDFHYLQKWVGHRNVRVGIYARAVEKREAWLGRPEFSSLAAGVALPADDPQHAFFYSRRWYLKGPLGESDEVAPRDCAAEDVGGNCKEDLIQLPVALWLITEGPRISSEDAAASNDQETRLQNSLQALQLRSTRRAAGIEFGEYAIDYAYLKEVRQDVIGLSPRAAGEGWETAIDGLGAIEAKIADRVVLIGDLEDTSDQTCPTPSMKPVSGVLIHACALATLNRGLVFRISNTLSWAAILWGALALLAAIVGLRLLYTRFGRMQQWPFQHVEILFFAALSVLLFFAFGWRASVRGVAWPHVLWVCGALIAYPFVSEPLFRAVTGMPRALRAAAPPLSGRARGV